jgi:hypothetical protein
MTNQSLRPPTQDEQMLPRWILEHGTNEAQSYLPQIEGLRARSSCTCGCPSISLVVSDCAAPAIVTKDRIVADLSGQAPEGISVGILVFQDGGRLTELEVYPYGNEGKFGLPTIESLSPFETGKPVA